jgi:hypothetical protein
MPKIGLQVVAFVRECVAAGIELALPFRPRNLCRDFDRVAERFWCRARAADDVSEPPSRGGVDAARRPAAPPVVCQLEPTAMLRSFD